jgi:hypothetical protein
VTWRCGDLITCPIPLPAGDWIPPVSIASFSAQSRRTRVYQDAFGSGNGGDGDGDGDGDGPFTG